MAVKKLLCKYHDDPSKSKHGQVLNEENFDPHLAARTRSKPVKTRSLMDLEWISVDRTLNPDEWDWREHFGRQGTNQKNEPKSVAHPPLVSDSLSQKVDEVDKPLGRWTCPFSREEIIRVWRLSDDNIKSSDERRCKTLLLKYNGKFVDYMRMQKESQTNNDKIRRRTGRNWETAQQNLSELATDVESRCRIVLSEIDKAAHCCDDYMESSVLHVIPQKFPTRVLRLELERELERVLIEHILEHEQRNPFLLEDESDSDSDGSTEAGEDNVIDTHARRMEKWAVKRAERASEIAKLEDRRVLLDAKSFRDLTLAKECESLGFGCCLACKKNPCEWKETVEEEEKLLNRTDAIHNELLFIQNNPNAEVMQSIVAKSSLNGGDSWFKRQDLIDELTQEKNQIECDLKLQRVDKELHDAYATRHNFVEVCSLHGYKTLLTTTDALVALEREHNRLVAMSSSKDVVDDILAWMLDGWYFGERETTENVIGGYVPSLKKHGIIRAGTEASNAMCAMKNGQKENSAQQTAEEMRGVLSEKVAPIATGAKDRKQLDATKKKCEKKLNDLDETETNVKFGLFCITFAYFRALHLVRREKASWSGQDNVIGGLGATPKTEERQKMMEEEENAKDRRFLLHQAMEKARIGEERKNRRLEHENEEKIRRLHAKYQKEAKEKAASLFIQRCYRGHLGRKVAVRWTLKRAEIKAMNALMNGCAITISRLWRGHSARLKAGRLRREMAEFIVAIRAEEAEEDERHYWETHRFARWKRDAKPYLYKKINRKKANGLKL